MQLEGNGVVSVMVVLAVVVVVVTEVIIDPGGQETEGIEDEDELLLAHVDGQGSTTDMVVVEVLANGQ